MTGSRPAVQRALRPFEIVVDERAYDALRESHLRAFDALTLIAEMPRERQADAKYAIGIAARVLAEEQTLGDVQQGSGG